MLEMVTVRWTEEYLYETRVPLAEWQRALAAEAQAILKEFDPSASPRGEVESEVMDKWLTERKSEDFTGSAGKTISTVRRWAGDGCEG